MILRDLSHNAAQKGQGLFVADPTQDLAGFGGGIDLGPAQAHALAMFPLFHLLSQELQNDLLPLRVV